MSPPKVMIAIKVSGGYVAVFYHPPRTAASLRYPATTMTASSRIGDTRRIV